MALKLSRTLKALPLLAIILCSQLAANGQIVSYRDRNVVDYQDHIQFSETISGNDAAEKYNGSPYKDDEFKEGIIYIDKTSQSNPVPMRYNMYTDKMEFKRGNYTYIMEPTLSIDMVSVGGQLYILGESVDDTKYHLGFYEVIDTGKVNVMMKQVVRLRAAQPPKAMESAPTPATYMKLGFEYYYQVGDGEVFKISKIKKMIESFPDRQEELMSYVKMEKISKKKEDLQKLVRHYNSLE